MNYKYAILIYIFSSILYTQENIPFDVSKQFAVPIENNQLLWNDDKSFNKLLIDRSSRNFKNKFTNLDFQELLEIFIFLLLFCVFFCREIFSSDSVNKKL